MRRDPIQIAQLEDGGTQSDCHRAIEIGSFPARVKKNQMIQLRLVSQTAKNYLRSEPRVASIERTSAFEKRIGGVLSRCNSVQGPRKRPPELAKFSCVETTVTGLWNMRYVLSNNELRNLLCLRVYALV